MHVTRERRRRYMTTTCVMTTSAMTALVETTVETAGSTLESAAEAT